MRNGSGTLDSRYVRARRTKSGPDGAERADCRDEEVSATDEGHGGTFLEQANGLKSVRSRPRRKAKMERRQHRTSLQTDRTISSGILPQTSVDTSSRFQMPSIAPSGRGGNPYLKDPNKAVDKFNIRYFKKPKPMSFYIQQQARYTQGRSSSGSTTKRPAILIDERNAGKVQESAAALSAKGVASLAVT
ncbi:MAG: hypothetical protein Q9165_003621 [Trypethelium subeluteriae]